MDYNALISALLKFQAWCDDNESLLRENSELQEKLDKAKRINEALRLALGPFAAVGRQTQDDLEDYLCHHHDHFLGHYRAAVAAMELSKRDLEPSSCT